MSGAGYTGFQLAPRSNGRRRTSADPKPAARKSAPSPDRPDLTWPSGRGDDAGVVLGAPAQLSRRAHLKAQRNSPVLRVRDVFENGPTLVIWGLADGPVGLTAEPEIARDRVAIIADPQVDPAPILAGLRRLFGAKAVVPG